MTVSLGISCRCHLAPVEAVIQLVGPAKLLPRSAAGRQWGWGWGRGGRTTWAAVLLVLIVGARWGGGGLEGAQTDALRMLWWRWRLNIRRRKDHRRGVLDR